MMLIWGIRLTTGEHKHNMSPTQFSQGQGIGKLFNAIKDEQRPATAQGTQGRTMRIGTRLLPQEPSDLFKGESKRGIGIEGMIEEATRKAVEPIRLLH